MKNLEEQLKIITEKIETVDFLDKHEIPDIDLYMDQVLTFLNAKLNQLNRNQEDITLTKTMINNYSKGDLLHSSYKKKYNKTHIMRLYIISQLKRFLTIQDIKGITDTFEDESFLNDMFDLLIKRQTEEFRRVEKVFNESLAKTQFVDCKDEQELMASLVIELIASSQVNILLAERIIDKLNDEE